MNRISSLDGLRGIAIAMVLFDHIQGSLNNNQPLYRWTRTGYHGVLIFFVLSGFLITQKMMDGGRDLKSFYLRRLFRLMPAAWTFLGSMIALDAIFGAHLTDRRALIASVCFYRDLGGGGGRDVVTGGFWSLSVEERYYLLWPWILLFFSVKRSVQLATIGVLGFALWRFILWAHHPQTPMLQYPTLWTGSILVGCILGILAADSTNRNQLAKSARFFPLPATALLCACIYFQQEWMLIFEQLSIGCLIATASLHPTSLFSRILSFRPLAWLGMISYRLYLWQGLFIPIRSVFGIAVLLPLAALSSYYCIERPMMRLGYRLTKSSALYGSERSIAL
jgi:peptidoglycan/LPS O-acetylase OafA/YrhL